MAQATCNHTPQLGALYAEWYRLENARGRTDEQVKADTSLQDKITRNMAAIPATSLAELRLKLAAAIGELGDIPDSFPLLRAVAADLDALAASEALDQDGGELAATLYSVSTDLETLACRLGSLVGAAGALGARLDTRDDPGPCQMAYSAMFVLEAIEKELDRLVHATGEAYRLARDGIGRTA